MSVWRRSAWPCRRLPAQVRTLWCRSGTPIMPLSIEVFISTSTSRRAPMRPRPMPLMLRRVLSRMSGYRDRTLSSPRDLVAFMSIGHLTPPLALTSGDVTHTLWPMPYRDMAYLLTVNALWTLYVFYVCRILSIKNQVSQKTWSCLDQYSMWVIQTLNFSPSSSLMLHKVFQRLRLPPLLV